MASGIIKGSFIKICKKSSQLSALIGNVSLLYHAYSRHIPFQHQPSNSPKSCNQGFVYRVNIDRLKPDLAYDNYYYMTKNMATQISKNTKHIFYNANNCHVNKVSFLSGGYLY